MDLAAVQKLADQVEGLRADVAKLAPQILSEACQFRATLENLAKELRVARQDYHSSVEPRWNATLEKVDEIEQILLQIGKKGGQLGLAQSIMETGAEWLRRHTARKGGG